RVLKGLAGRRITDPPFELTRGDLGHRSGQCVLVEQRLDAITGPDVELVEGDEEQNPGRDDAPDNFQRGASVREESADLPSGAESPEDVAQNAHDADERDAGDDEN